MAFSPENSFTPENLFAQEFADHAAIVEATRQAVTAPLLRLLEASEAAIRSGGKILIFGNGGSAGDAQHIAAELTIRYVRDRRPIAAIALSTDTSALTACANDFGYQHVFARQLAALGRPGDIAIGISTSGKSPNVLAALETARGMGIAAAGLAGKDGGAMRDLADPLLIVPSNVTARIQEMHILIGHMFCDALERRLGLV